MYNDADKLKTMMDMQDHIILITDGTSLEYINKAFFHFTKFKNFEEFKKVHKCICELFVDIEDESYLKSNYSHGNWIAHLEQNPTKEFFLVMKTLENTNTVFKINFKQFDNTSKSYMINLYNVTSDKESLDLLNLISTMENVYFSVADMNGHIIKISPSLLKILKIDDFTETKYSIEDVLNKKDKQIAFEHIRTNNSSPYEVTLRYNNVVLPIMVQGYFGVLNHTPVRVTVLIDQREIKQLQDEAKQKDLLLFQQAKMAQMGEMITMIAHQWRQPLNAISAASIQSTMKKELEQLSDEDFYQIQDFIQNQCQKMSKVINTFMEYSNKKQIQENFFFNDILNMILNLIKVQFNAHNININIECDNSFKLYGTKDMLEQVILNILMNARDAYDERETIEKKIIYIKTTEEETIEITDFAGGINKTLHNKIFMPYFTTKEQGKGTGLGLYISKRIMQEHFKGDLFYENLENGSKFILDFKIKNKVKE